MPMGRPKAALTLTDDERQKRQAWSRRGATAQRLALRARIILACAELPLNQDVARKLQVRAATLGNWRTRFLARRLDGWTDEPRPGAPRKITHAHVEEVVTRTLESKPKNATQWSTREMAQASGLSQSAITRIWRALGLKPHRAETFKWSTDPCFVEQVRDVVGLHLNPPDKAIVLCVDEKRQVQALDRTQPLLPMEPWQVERGTHDYARHRQQEFWKILKHMDATIVKRPGVAAPWVMDNYDTRKTPSIKRTGGFAARSA